MYLVGPCVDLGLFMSYLCVLFLNFRLIFIAMNQILLSEETQLFFVHYLEYLVLFLDGNVNEKSE